MTVDNTNACPAIELTEEDLDRAHGGALPMKTSTTEEEPTPQMLRKGPKIERKIAVYSYSW